MKSDRIARLYGVLTSKEKAALTLRHLVNGNDRERRRIESSVERKSYECLDREYRIWFEGFFHMASLWSVMHWQLRSQQMAFLGQYSIERRDDTLEKFIRIESRLAALDMALDAICEEHGLDFTSVRKLAGTDAFEPTFPDLMSDLAYMGQVCLSLIKCLPL